jgi:hypothetical protein
MATSLCIEVVVDGCGAQPTSRISYIERLEPYIDCPSNLFPAPVGMYRCPG